MPKSIAQQIAELRCEIKTLELDYSHVRHPMVKDKIKNMLFAHRTLLMDLVCQLKHRRKINPTGEQEKNLREAIGNDLYEALEKATRPWDAKKLKDCDCFDVCIGCQEKCEFFVPRKR